MLPCSDTLFCLCVCVCVLPVTFLYEFSAMLKVIFLQRQFIEGEDVQTLQDMLTAAARANIHTDHVAFSRTVHLGTP